MVKVILLEWRLERGAAVGGRREELRGRGRAAAGAERRHAAEARQLRERVPQKGTVGYYPRSVRTEYHYFLSDRFYGIRSERRVQLLFAIQRNSES